MPYVKVICPSCGGEIQLDDTKEFGFCLHCGTKVIFEDAVQRIELVNQPKLDNLYKLAMEAYTNRDFNEAITYFNRVLEIAGDNWRALLYKGLSKAYIAQIKTNPIGPLTQCISQVIDLASKDKETTLYEAKRLIVPELSNFFIAIISVADLTKYSKYETIAAYDEYKDNFLNILSGFESCLNWMDENYPQDLAIVYGNILRLISALTVHKQLSDGRKVGINKNTRKILWDKFETYAPRLTKLSPKSEIPSFNRKNIEGGRV